MEVVVKLKEVINNILDNTGESWHDVTFYKDGDDPSIALDGNYTVETLEKICSLMRLGQAEINLRKYEQ